MSKKVNKLLSQADKEVRDAKGGLSVMFRKIMAEINFTPMDWNRAMRRYLDNPKNGVSNTSRDRSTTRGNLNRELIKTDMTWRNFMRALSFLDPIGIEFHVHLTWKNNRTTVHTLKIRDPKEEADRPEVEE